MFILTDSKTTKIAFRENFYTLGAKINALQNALPSEETSDDK